MTTKVEISVSQENQAFALLEVAWVDMRLIALRLPFALPPAVQALDVMHLSIKLESTLCEHLSILAAGQTRIQCQSRPTSLRLFRKV
jgi:hypothetical protein